MTPSELLLNASYYGNLGKVKLCLEKGADVHYRNERPLRWAARHGHKHVCRELLKHGASFEESIIWAKKNTWSEESISAIIKTRDETETEAAMEQL